MKALLLTIVAILVVGTGSAAADVFPLCVTARLGAGLGAAKIDFTLAVETFPNSPMIALSGQASFSQPVSPPGSLIVYAVSGAAIPNADGIWASLSGTGYDLAKNVYRGTFTAQLSSDALKNTFSYTRQNLDGSGSATSTSSIPLTVCGQ